LHTTYDTITNCLDEKKLDSKDLFHLLLSGQLRDTGLRGSASDPVVGVAGMLEVTNGALMFGVSAAMVFAVIQRLVLAKFEDLRY